MQSLNYHDIYLENYYSPFPREKSNREVLKQSYAKRMPDNETIIDIPPSVTATYMNKNPLYFDIKKHQNRVSAPKKRPKSSNYRTNKSTKNKTKNNYIIYDSKNLDQILKDTKNNYLAPRPKLSKGKEIITGKIYKPMNPRPQLTPSEALAIITKLPLPQPPKNEFPNYISEFKIREFIEKEYERLVEEQKGYPPGTFKVWEEDRILILTNLFLIREELLEELRKFPVDYFLRSIGIRNRRREVERRLDEVEYAIRLFQMSDVFLKF